jgi:hypothetical protein
MGRRAHQPDSVTRRQVEAMAAYGIPEADIATVIEIDPKTLRRHYRKELDTGHIKANTKVAENLYRKATGDGRESVVAAIFWLKTRARWKETTIHEVTEGTAHDSGHSDARRLGAVALLVARAQRRKEQYALPGGSLPIERQIADEAEK